MTSHDSVPDIQYPAAFRVADRASIAGQLAYRRLLAVELIAVVAGTVLGAGIGWLSASPVLAGVVAATTFLGAITARLVRERRQDDQRWFDGRAVAESAKTQTWRYMMRVPPFDDDSTADRQFAVRLSQLIHSRSRIAEPDVEPVRPDAQINERMRGVRALGVEERREAYISGRLLEQAEWYRVGARRHRSIGQLWSWLSLASEAVAIAIALVTVVTPAGAQLGLLGVFGAGAAACTAWAQIGRHDESARAYALAYQELLLICDLARTADDEAGLRQVVLDGEGAISREHTMWMAKRVDESRPASEWTLAAIGSPTTDAGTSPDRSRPPQN